MKEIILSAREVSKSFSTTIAETNVLDKISIEFYKGDFTVTMGPSGAGKSTLLYTISGMERINAGRVSYQGKDISNLKEKQMATLRAKEFGFVFQQTNLVSYLTLEENVLVAGYISKEKNENVTRQIAGKLLDKMNILDARKRLPKEVSGGEAQRAAVARAVINSPKVLFADEPTGALNKANTIEVLDLLSKLHKEGQSIIMVTHDVHAAIRGNRILYLEDGRIKGELKLSNYSMSTVKQNEEQLNTWLGTMEW